METGEQVETSSFCHSKWKIKYHNIVKVAFYNILKPRVANPNGFFYPTKVQTSNISIIIHQLSCITKKSPEKHSQDHYVFKEGNTVTISTFIYLLKSNQKKTFVAEGVLELSRRGWEET